MMKSNRLWARGIFWKSITGNVMLTRLKVIAIQIPIGIIRKEEVMLFFHMRQLVVAPKLLC